MTDQVWQKQVPRLSPELLQVISSHAWGWFLVSWPDDRQLVGTNQRRLMRLGDVLRKVEKNVVYERPPYRPTNVGVDGQKETTGKKRERLADSKVKKCTICKKSLPQWDYAKRQWKRNKAADRKCKDCAAEEQHKAQLKRVCTTLDCTRLDYSAVHECKKCQGGGRVTL